jgi:hypothetical protein
MFVRITPGDVTLEEADDCTRLHVDARGVDDERVGRALRDDALGAFDADHAFLDPAALRRLAAGRVGDDWNERFGAMVDYATSKGWVAADGRLQAHVERTTP